MKDFLISFNHFCEVAGIFRLSNRVILVVLNYQFVLLLFWHLRIRKLGMKHLNLDRIQLCVKFRNPSSTLDNFCIIRLHLLRTWAYLNGCQACLELALVSSNTSGRDFLLTRNFLCS